MFLIKYRVVTTRKTQARMGRPY